MWTFYLEDELIDKYMHLIHKYDLASELVVQEPEFI